MQFANTSIYCQGEFAKSAHDAKQWQAINAREYYSLMSVVNRPQMTIRQTGHMDKDNQCMSVRVDIIPPPFFNSNMYFMVYSDRHSRCEVKFAFIADL